MLAIPNENETAVQYFQVFLMIGWTLIRHDKQHYEFLNTNYLASLTPPDLGSFNVSVPMRTGKQACLVVTISSLEFDVH